MGAADADDDAAALRRLGEVFIFISVGSIASRSGGLDATLVPETSSGYLSKNHHHHHLLYLYFGSFA